MPIVIFLVLYLIWCCAIAIGIADTERKNLYAKRSARWKP
jgi:hypothetical protein